MATMAAIFLFKGNIITAGQKFVLVLTHDLHIGVCLLRYALKLVLTEIQTVLKSNMAPIQTELLIKDLS